MSRFFVAPDAPAGWARGLASPSHWKPGYSAHALAHAWHIQDGFPASVQDAFARSELGALEFVAGIPEYKVALPGGRAASQTDLLVLARTATDETAVIAVEGKVREPFGDNTVADWRAAGGSGREDRLRFLREVLALPDDETLAGHRYQLLHRTASPLIESKRLNATHAVMLVHSFGGGNAWFDEFASFASALGAEVELNTIARARNVERSLYVGWISDPLPEDV